jgi:hypothetical protein
MALDPATIATAKASNSRKLYLPAGDYSIAPGLMLDGDYLEVYGDGIGITRLICDGLAISGVVSLLTLNANRVTLRDLSIIITNTSGTGQLIAVRCDYACTRPRLARIEVVGGYGTTPAGGSAFNFYRSPLTDMARQYAVVEDCVARDAPNTTGFIVNSNHNTFIRCESRDLGTLVGQHGYYIQGGYNRFEGCKAIRVKGYSFNATCNVVNQDASANVFDDCLSEDPGGLHMVVDGSTYTADGSNPDVPAGAPVGRGAMIVHCTFRRSVGGPACNGVNVGKNAVIQGCYFEDAVGIDLGQWLILRDGSTAAGNMFVGTNHPAAITSAQQGIVTLAGCTVIGNRMHGGQRMIGIKPGARTLVTGNSIDLPATNTSSGIIVNGDGVTLRDNRITVGGGVAIGAIGTPVGTINENNY